MAIHSSFLPRKSHGQRRLESYSPWGHKESDTTDHMCAHAHVHTHTTDVFAFRPTILLFGSCFPYFVPDALFLPSLI